MNVDRINRRILRYLEKDGRISNSELAQKVGLSPSACLRRVQELEKSGIVKGYRAVINRQAMGSGFTVIVTIALSDHRKASQLDFEKAILAAPEVRECHNVAGNFEYILKVEVENLEAYKQFHGNVLGTIPDVRGITSYISMETVKDDRD
jgi:Lrp/AsnC family leucine-responsive transcriptional regulator